VQRVLVQGEVSHRCVGCGALSAGFVVYGYTCSPQSSWQRQLPGHCAVLCVLAVSLGAPEALVLAMVLSAGCTLPQALHHVWGLKPIGLAVVYYVAHAPAAILGHHHQQRLLMMP
jgi:hypothetical protein